MKMNKYLGLIILAATLLLAGCSQQIGDYVAASSISRNGFARDAAAMRKLDGQEIKIWGFVDHDNLYGDEGAKEILGDRWSGEGLSPTTWRVDLKAKADDEAGHSFSVHVPNDPGRDDLLKAFVADARAGKPTRVFVKGRIFTFDAPTNVTPLTGLYMELQSSDNIRLQLPEEK